MATHDPTLIGILSASITEPDDHDLAREIREALGPEDDLGDGLSVGELLPRVRRLRRGVDEATSSFLRALSRADAAGELTMPAYVALADELQSAQVDVVRSALASILPPPLRR